MQEKKRILTDCISHMSVLKEKYVKELNTINYYYWPIISEKKKSVKNADYVLTLIFCVLVIALIASFLGVIEGDYGKIIVIAAAFALVCIAGFYDIKVRKKYKEKKQTWDASLANLNPIKEKIDALEIVVVNDIITIVMEKENRELLNKAVDDKELYQRLFDKKKEQLTATVGYSSEELIPFYYSWLENN